MLCSLHRLVRALPVWLAAAATAMAAGCPALAAGPAAASGKLKVAATNGDLAAITGELGGSAVDVAQLVPSQMEPHAMPLRPSLIQKVREAQLLVTIGLDHEPWLFDVVTSSGNGRAQQGGSGYVDVSDGIKLLQVPIGSVDRSRGDLHIFGNTHYWLDPGNAEIIAVHITQALSRALPAQTEAIRKRARGFLTDLKRRSADWRRRLARFAGTKVVSYHLTWPYLEQFAGFQVVGTLEIKPGIEASPAHLARLREQMKGMSVRHVLMEPWYNQGRARSLAQDVGARVVVIAPSTPEGARYADHMETVVGLLEKAFGSGGGGRP